MKKINSYTAGKQWVFLLLLLFSYPLMAQPSPKLSDPEIASVAVVANQVDIDYAQIALKNSTNADVLQFAKTMKNDHQAVIDQAVALVTRLNVTPKSSSISEQLLADAEKTKKELMGKKGKAFDKAYISNEVTYHKAVIAAVETVLIPGATNKELKSLLENVLPALKTHLAHAEMLEKKINK